MLTPPEQPQDQQTMTASQLLEPTTPEMVPKSGTSRKKIYIIAGAVLLIVILAGAAFLAGTLMNNKTNNPNGLLSFITRNRGSVPGQHAVKVGSLKPAKELPAVQADVRGLFVSRSGNSIIIGTGQLSIGISKSSSGAVTPQASYNGPTYEVVVTKDTLVYQDTTALDFSSSSSAPTQQTVAIGTLDDLNTMTDISVWGKKTGDRYVADVLVYSSPMIKMNGGAGGATK